MGQTLAKHKLTKSEIRGLQRHVSFSDDEIKDWYQEFCRSISKTQQDLFLSEDEFAKVYNSVYPGQCDEFARHVFRTFDLDGNNKVDFREFLIGLSFSGSRDMQKQLSWAFQVYDVKRTGFVTLESMTQIIRAVFKMIGPRALHHNNLTITAESLAGDLFSQMDQDGNQRVSWLQFREGVMKNPMALQLLQCSPPESVPEADKEEDDDAFYR